MATIAETVPTPCEPNSIELREQVPVQVQPVELGSYVHNEITRVKTERITFYSDTNGKLERKFLSLEKPFVDALDRLAELTNTDRKTLLKNILVGNPDHAAAIVRNTIVTELLTRVQSC